MNFAVHDELSRERRMRPLTESESEPESESLQGQLGDDCPSLSSSFKLEHRQPSRFQCFHLLVVIVVYLLDWLTIYDNIPIHILSLHSRPALSEPRSKLPNPRLYSSSVRLCLNP